MRDYTNDGLPEMIIFSPGPANISERVRQALALPDICHRDQEFSDLLGEVKTLLAGALKIEDQSYEIVLFSGSGTLAMESLIACFSGWEKSLLVISNGIYGERAAAIANLYGVNVHELRLNWGVLPQLPAIEEQLRKPHIGGIYLVHHETTTGLLNPLKEISLLAKKYNKLVLSDTISSIAGEHLDLNWGIDAALGTANKCFRGVPGVSFVVLSEELVSIARNRVRRTFYSDLMMHLDREFNGQMPFTPPVQPLFAFREALKEVMEEGVGNRILHYQNISSRLRAGAKDLGLRLFLDEKLYSNTMTSVHLSQDVTFEELHDKLKERGFIIYNAHGRLRGQLFMLGVVGAITMSDIENFLAALGDVLEEVR